MDLEHGGTVTSVLEVSWLMGIHASSVVFLLMTCDGAVIRCVMSL
jgi:hypothetical protein